MYVISIEGNQRIKCIGVLATVATFGLLFTFTFLANLITNHDQFLPAFVNGYSLLFSVGLTVSAEWLRRQQFTGDELIRIGGWMLGGTLPIAFATWLTLFGHTTYGQIKLLGDIAHVAIIGACGGLLTGVLFVGQRKTTDQLQDARGRIESILSASPLPIISVDSNGRIETWNPAAEHTFGWAQDEVLGESLSSMTHSPGFDTLVSRFKRGELTDGNEGQCRTKSGESIDVRTYFSPIYDGTGISGGMTIVQDITEEKQRDRELTVSRELLAWTEKMADVGGWELNLRTDEVRWTDGTRRIYEVDDDFEPDLESAISFYRSSDQDRLEHLVEQAIETGEPYVAELRLVTAQGKERWVEVRGDRTDQRGTTNYLRGAIRDITDQKEQEQRLMVLNRVLRHNLRNDLNVIQGHAQMLHDDLANLELSPELQESADAPEIVATLSELTTTSDGLQTQISRFLEDLELLESFPVERAQDNAETIVRKSGELVTLGDKARQFERLVSDTDGATVEGIAVQPLLEQVVDRYRSRYPGASVTMTCEEGLWIMGDERMVEAAIEELVENAIKHTDDSAPEVKVTATGCEKARVEVCVSDRGPGLPQIEYEALHRGEETPLIHGLGLGLWLVNWAMARVSGSVAVEENTPTGTRVSITLPASEERMTPSSDAIADR